MGFIGIILSWILSEGGRWSAGVWYGRRVSNEAGTKPFAKENHYI